MDQVRTRNSSPGQNLREAGEIAAMGREHVCTKTECEQPGFGFRQFDGIDIKAEKASAGLQTWQDLPRVPAITERAINGEFTGLRREDFEDFGNHDWAVSAGGCFSGGKNFRHGVGIAPRIVLLVFLLETARVSARVAWAAAVRQRYRVGHNEASLCSLCLASNGVSCDFMRMSSQRIMVVGGGAAGVFAAITCAAAAPGAEVTVLEKGPQFLSKVRISGGGRCNVTHACFDVAELSIRYPRGAHPLLGPFKIFQATDTVAWFEARGVKLKTEKDGRIFPISDSSQTIIDCLLSEARAVGVELLTNHGLERVVRRPEGGFELELANGETLTCDRLLLATGGCRGPAAGQIAVSLGHALESPVPSLFTFHITTPWLRELAGISVESAEASVPDAKLKERGALLITHWGVSGPVILRLSAWGARTLHGLNYEFPLQLNWLPNQDAEALAAQFQSRRQSQAARLIVNTPLPPLPSRLWEQLVLAAGIARDTRWSSLSRSAQHHLAQQLLRTQLPVSGKSLNKEEFVTCGGVRLSEVNFKTMQSRICPGLFFAGELLDIDGITGGFNFQAAWTTGWIAGHAMAASSREAGKQ